MRMRPNQESQQLLLIGAHSSSLQCSPHVLLLRERRLFSWHLGEFPRLDRTPRSITARYVTTGAMELHVFSTAFFATKLAAYRAFPAAIRGFNVVSNDK